ncbi:MAG TPA: acetone carboxylase subunit gamma [Solirubrobacterales bacterium]|nr:acetone carboxylase subunit gamma [Solirubrobacterales bacterium]
MQVSDALELTGEGVDRGYRCLRCEQSLGAATENYKLSAAIEQVELSEGNRYIGDPGRYVDERMVLRRFYCPGCGTLLDTEVARQDDPPLHDIEIA